MGLFTVQNGKGDRDRGTGREIHDRREKLANLKGFSWSTKDEDKEEETEAERIDTCSGCPGRRFSDPIMCGFCELEEIENPNE